jgi:FkbM family methyltransferase
VAKVLKSVRNYIQSIFSKLDRNVVDNLLNQDSIVLMDVGAAGGIEPRWKKFAGKVSYVGFEPDGRAQEFVPNVRFAEYEMTPSALGESRSVRRLNITKDVGKSSLFVPNWEILERFPNVDRFSVSKELKLQINTADKIVKSKVDFIKLDIQGSELGVLKGAKGILKEVLGVETEVEFLELYSGQPLFGQVNEYLRRLDFEFIDFVNLRRWERNSFSGLGQLTFGDALFLKSPETVINGDIREANLRKYLAILYIYNRFDLIERCYQIVPSLTISLSRFYKHQKRKAKFLNSLHRFNRLISFIHTFFGVEFKSHTIY